jgi:predicted ATPase/DNA-binding SARP family transcriptional activator/Tfp pilus assembly protein PilF
MLTVRRGDVSQSESSGTLSLRLLGPPSIELDGAPVEVDTRKAVALLAYLAVSEQAHSRESLAALFWPEYDQERAYANLRRTLWAFNKAAGTAWLHADQETIGLAPDADLWTDVGAFRGHLAACRSHGHPESEVCAACLDPLARAVALYRDDFLAGFTLRDSPAFDEWQFFEAETLRGELASALEKLVRGHTAGGDLAPAIEYARGWLALDPLHEPAHRELMKLYAWDGRRGAALRQYQECARVLDEELGIPPEAETTRLYEAIQRNELHPAQRVPAASAAVAATTFVATAPAPRHNLPPQPTPFVGRAPELAEITALLADPACRLLTLVGPGGVGKTRLALQAAEQAVGAFPHGVHFVPLAPIESAGFLVPTIAAALDFSFFQREGVEPRQQLLDYLREKGMLLLLDNFEHLVDGAGLLAELSGHAPGVKLLVTSRERLHLRGEWAFDVKGMRFPQDGEEAIEALADYSAVKLFLQHAGQAQAGFSPAEDEWLDLVRICRLVEGVPLGIELAAAWVRMLSCREIAAEIEKSLDFLSTSLRDAPERHRSLRAVFDHSWQLLSEAERAALARLSVFRGGFGREAAQQVAGASLPLLASLADKSLLQRDTSGRYGMHEAVRQYAADKLKVLGDEAAVRDQHCRTYATFLEQRTNDLCSRRQIEALVEVTREIENVRAAWRWATTQAKVPELWRAATGLAIFFHIRSLFQEGEAAFRQAAAALEAVRQQGTTDEIDRTLGLLWAYQGQFAHRLYQHEVGRQLLQRSLSLLRPLGLGMELAMANLWGVTVGLVDDATEAEQRCQQTLGYFQSVGNAWGVGLALTQLSELAQLRGDITKAKHHLQEAIADLSAVGDRWGIAFALFGLGSLAQHQGGERAEAKRHYLESLEMRRELGDRWGMSICLDYIGYLAREMGQYDEARPLHEESQAISREIGDRLGVAGSLDNLGLVACDEGDFGEAVRYFEEGLALRRQVGRSWDVAVSLRHMGDAALGLGDLAGAAQWYGDSLKTLQSSWERWGIERTLLGLAEVALERGDAETARQHLGDGLRASVENGHLSNSLRVLVGVARLLANTGRDEPAAGLLVYVHGYPGSTVQARERAGRLLAKLTEHLPPSRIEAARNRFEGTPLEAVIEQILAEI